MLKISINRHMKIDECIFVGRWDIFYLGITIKRRVRTCERVFGGE